MTRQKLSGIIAQICGLMGAATDGVRGKHKVVIFAKSRQGVRSILDAVEGDEVLQNYFRPLRLVGKGSGGRFMSVRKQVH